MPLECGIIFDGIPEGAIPRKVGLIWGIPDQFFPDAVRIPYQAEGIGRTDDAMWGKHKGSNTVYKPHSLGKVPEDWWPINILNANDPERVG